MRFVTAREQDVRFQAREGSRDPSRYGVGDSIRVLYDPANPRNARVDTWGSRRGDSLTMVAIGLGLVGLGAVGLWLLRSSGELLDVRRSRTGLLRTLRAERLVGHHATSIITGTKIVGVGRALERMPAHAVRT